MKVNIHVDNEDADDMEGDTSDDHACGNKDLKNDSEKGDGGGKVSESDDKDPRLWKYDGVTNENGKVDGFRQGVPDEIYPLPNY